jgi:hypothetical protein
MVLACVWFAANLASATMAAAAVLRPIRPDQENSVIRAVFSGGKLWLLADAGQLFTITEGQSLPVEESPPEPVLDLCVQDAVPLAITCQRENCASWTLRRWDGGRWSPVEGVQTKGDDLLATACASGHVTLLTSRRLIEAANGTRTSVTLSESTRAA